MPFVDIFDKSGKPLSRVDVRSILNENDLALQNIKSVKFLRLQWSGRRIDDLEQTKVSVLKKVVIVGECIFQEKFRPFIMKVNLETQKADVIKILSIEDKISTINYGPYDNGYLLIGMVSG